MVPEFDLTKKFNRFDFLVAGVSGGIMAALGGDTRWSLLCAIYDHLPNTRPGINRLAQVSGLSERTIGRKLKELKAAGLIHYDESNRGGPRNTHAFVVQDIRDKAVRDKIIRGLQPPQLAGVHIQQRDHQPPQIAGVQPPQLAGGSKQGGVSNEENNVKKHEQEQPPQIAGVSPDAGATAPSTPVLSLSSTTSGSCSMSEHPPERLPSLRLATTEGDHLPMPQGSPASQPPPPTRTSQPPPSDHDKAAILSDPWNIWGWLNFGNAYIKSGFNHQGLPPAELSWFQHIEADAPRTKTLRLCTRRTGPHPSSPRSIGGTCAWPDARPTPRPCCRCRSGGSETGSGYSTMSIRYPKRCPR